MGMGFSETTPEVMATAKMWMQSFHDAVNRMAVALNYALDDMEFFMEHATASERIDLGWFVMEKDTNAALCGGWKGKVKGKTVIQMKLTWYLTKLLNQGWNFPDAQYEITIKGEPEVRTQMQFVPPQHWGNHEWDTMTAMPVVSAAFNVKAAKPGIVSLMDIGLPVAPAGLWNQK
jgi:2,4-diaminopentanoate dehydrogenase